MFWVNWISLETGRGVQIEVKIGTIFHLTCFNKIGTGLAQNKKGFFALSRKPLILLARLKGFEPLAYGLEVRVIHYALFYIAFHCFINS
ncbi:MAG: hypothetical protein C4518_04860 [Desulfobacteraceae bacterium]|nr:MAG: hypothetical protein C4518_04860 [Desulfobacteraceae bacterium]